MVIDKALVAAIFVFASTTQAYPAPDNPPAQPTPEPGHRFRECRNCPEMVVIPPGTFTMGSPQTEIGRFKNEGPERRVTIAHTLAIGAYPVTRKEYRHFVRATRRPTPDSCRIYDESFVDSDLVRVRGKNWTRPNFHQRDDHPVVCISWDDALAYAAWLNSQVNSQLETVGSTGPYRLPSEAE